MDETPRTPMNNGVTDTTGGLTIEEILEIYDDDSELYPVSAEEVDMVTLIDTNVKTQIKYAKGAII